MISPRILCSVKFFDPTVSTLALEQLQTAITMMAAQIRANPGALRAFFARAHSINCNTVALCINKCLWFGLDRVGTVAATLQAER